MKSEKFLETFGTSDLGRAAAAAKGGRLLMLVVMLHICAVANFSLFTFPF